MRMLQQGKSFRIYSTDPLEAKVLYAAGLWPDCPRASGITMEGGRAIDFHVEERQPIRLVAERMFYEFPESYAWAFDTLTTAAIQGVPEAWA